ncbi:type VII toxin-antitoxin system HepT family RNase toxin [Thermosediminibacter litoriperuensis]|uniref:Uncharacterized protein YutE (UPF0331/DUF86 family) n=1 Tax=Thermosediminibacter litoriperuensis TaxID=291989 RepID=A0A5S5ARS6_9FIRM|nr:DUF86 domain-containing protein [Thermosediminibacter litoriperuensis]TYP53312.1 uncharacterized protein YutE (UPF0331/DUF86 family) [Thermosediminibacter litoriperuensis]
MINKMAIIERLELIQSYLKELEELKKFPKEEFLKSGIYTGAAESYLRRSLEAIFDIGRHILAKTGHIDLTLEYKSIAKGLQKENIVDEELGQKLLEMAGYLNRMVHLYNLITNEELYQIICDDLDDIKDFVKAIMTYLNR